jgi:hypothetical protein
MATIIVIGLFCTMIVYMLGVFLRHRRSEREDNLAVLRDIFLSLGHLSAVARDADEPTRAVLQAQIFLLTQKVRYLLGDDD